MKKGKHFYSHIVTTDSIVIALGNLGIGEEEKAHLVHLAETNLHNVILDAILSELSEDDKKKFLLHLHEDDHGKIWELLNDKTDNIEEKITKAAEDLKKQLHKDIEETREKA